MHLHIFSRRIEFLFDLCVMEIQIVLFKKTYDRNHPRLALDLNIFDQTYNGDVTEDNGSWSERFPCLFSAPLTVLKYVNKRKRQYIDLTIFCSHQSTETTKVFFQDSATIFSDVSIIDSIENIQVQSQSGVISGPLFKSEFFADDSAIFTRLQWSLS